MALRSKPLFAAIMFCSLCVIGLVSVEVNNLRLKENKPKKVVNVPKAKVQKPKPNRTVSERLPLSRALSRSNRQRRHLQEEPSMSPDNLHDFVSKLPRLEYADLSTLLDGAWRVVGKRINQNAIPAIDTVLDRLSSARFLANSIKSQLGEITVVIDNIPILVQSLSNIDAEETVGQSVSRAAIEERQRIKFKENFRTSGAFGLRGLFGSLEAGGSAALSLFFESTLFDRFRGLFRPRILNGLHLSGMNSVEQAGFRENLQAASHAEQDAHVLGAQVDALTTMFSGGVQIPFIQSLLDVDKSFSLLLANMADVNYWSKAVMALQQLREDLVRLPIAWILSSDQSSIVQSAAGIIDKLLGHIGNNCGAIGKNLLLDISSLLEDLGKAILPLDGTVLRPSVNVYGVDLSKCLGGDLDGLLSFPLRLADLSFLRNGFRIPQSFIEVVERNPVALGVDGLTKRSTTASPQFVTNLLARSIGVIPVILAEAVRAGIMLASVADALDISLEKSSGWDSLFYNRVGETLAASSGLEEMLNRFLRVGSNRDPTKLASDGQLISLVKSVQLENAMKTVQRLVNNLSQPAEFVRGIILPEEFQIGFLSVFSIVPRNGSSSFEGGALESGNSSLVETLAGSFMSPSQEPVSSVSNDVSLMISEQQKLEKKSEWILVLLEEILNKASLDEETVLLASVSSMVLSSLVSASSIIEEGPVTCRTDAEVEATTAVRAAALLGNPVDVMAAGGTSEATMVELLRPSDGLKSDALVASSPLCEERLLAISLLQQWIDGSVGFFSDVLESMALGSTPESMQYVVGNLTALVSPRQQINYRAVDQ